MFGKKTKKKDEFMKVEFTPQQLFYTNALSIEALVNVLERKGLLKKGEVLEEIKKIGSERKQQMEEVNGDIKKS